MTDDLLNALVASLHRCGLVPASEMPRLSPLAGGVSCDVWLVERADGARFVAKRALPQLRVAAEWLAPVERAENEVRWLRSVRAIDRRLAPEVVATAPDEHFFATRYLDPATHPVWRDELIAGRIDAAFAGSLGLDLAHIHSVTATDAATPRDFADAELFEALRIAPFLRYVAERRPEVAPRLTAIADDLATRRIALVHGDVSPKNILCGPVGAVFLDAECAVYGDPAFDLAFCTTHLLLKTIWLADHAGVLRHAAMTFAIMYLEGADWEPAEALSQRAAALIAALLLARVEGKSPAPYLTPGNRDAVRANALALLARPYLALDELIAEWPKETR